MTPKRLLRFRFEHVLGVALAGVLLDSAPLWAQPGTGVIRVTTSGTDGASCGSASAPCRNPQHAVLISQAGDEIRIAQGTYTYQPVLDPCSATLGTTAVVCVVNRAAKLRGGFDGVQWTSPSFGSGATVLSGESLRRVVLAEDAEANPTRTVLELSNLTLANGRAVPRTLGSGDALLFAFGGGLEGVWAKVLVRDVVFTNNVAQGAASGGPYGGTGAGGAVSVRQAPAGSLFERVAFFSNQALGGAGSVRGGFGIGGAFFSYRAQFTGQDWLLWNNQALAGSSNGAGLYLGETADGQGGAVAFQMGSQATVERLTGSYNLAMGGGANTGSGIGGGAFGGGVFLEGGTGADMTSVTLRDVRLEANEARGSSSALHGGYASGGGLQATNASILLERIRVLRNLARGGNGSGNQGPAGGGGLTFARSTIAATATVTDGVIASNEVQPGSGAIVGGGGGGVWVQGIHATLSHVTLAANRLSASYLQGHGLLALSWIDPAQVSLANSVVSHHSVPSGPAALHVQTGSSLQYQRVLHGLNVDFSNEGDAGSGTFTGQGTLSEVTDVHYRAAPEPQRNFRLNSTSPAINAAVNSSSVADADNAPRDANPDLGAFEFSSGQIFREDFELGDLGGWISPP